MGREVKIITRCDGPGCTLTHERLQTENVYEGIQKIEVGLNSSPYWRGYLCAACERKLVEVLKDPFATKISHPPGSPVTPT